MRSVSMALAGTDFQHHRHFITAAEDYRRVIQRTMNDDIMAHPTKGTYIAGKELWERVPEFDYEDFGVPAVVGEPTWANPSTRASYQLYEQHIDGIARESGYPREELAVRRGSFLIWSANLLHGGSPRDDRTLTRKSQVTHYYFNDAVPFTPMYSRRSEDSFAVFDATGVESAAHDVVPHAR